MAERVLTVDPRILAHCRLCFEPMYCIYDSALRDYCHECLLDVSRDDAKERRRPA
jgi:hypothetical protein